MQQLHKVINAWRETDLKTLEGILRKLPYFELVGEGVWSYNPTVRVLYEDLLKRFLSIINKQKERWHRGKHSGKASMIHFKALPGALSGKQEAAAALAEKMELEGRHEHLLTQMAEKTSFSHYAREKSYVTGNTSTNWKQKPTAFFTSAASGSNGQGKRRKKSQD